MFVDWNKVIETSLGPLFGVIIGGGITITALFIKEYFDRKRTVQLWFEQEFIANALDPILSYFEMVQVHLQLKIPDEAGFKMMEWQLGQVPSEAVIRVSTLIHHGSLGGLLRGIAFAIDKTLGVPLSKEEIGILSDFMTSIIIELQILRRELVQLKLSRKVDVYELATKNKRISRKLKEMEKELSNKFLSVKAEIYKPVAPSSEGNQQRNTNNRGFEPQVDIID